MAVTGKQGQFGWKKKKEKKMAGGVVYARLIALLQFTLVIEADCDLRSMKIE